MYFGLRHELLMYMLIFLKYISMPDAPVNVDKSTVRIFVISRISSSSHCIFIDVHCIHVFRKNLKIFTCLLNSTINLHIDTIGLHNNESTEPMDFFTTSSEFLQKMFGNTTQEFLG